MAPAERARRSWQQHVAEFSDVGYDRTSMRSIAAEAEVDQKLVGHFFGSKHALFVAATELPFDPASAISHVLGGPTRTRGDGLARLIVGMLENPEVGPKLIGLVRASAADPDAATMVRDVLSQQIWGPAAARLGLEQPDATLSLGPAWILGVVMARYVIRAEPLASFSPDSVVELIAPALQRLLTGAD